MTKVPVFQETTSERQILNEVHRHNFLQRPANIPIGRMWRQRIEVKKLIIQGRHYAFLISLFFITGLRITYCMILKSQMHTASHTQAKNARLERLLTDLPR